MKHIVIAALLLGSPVNAGPDATTNYLMDTPASMLDIGIVRLKSFLANRGHMDTVVSFSWDKNQIVMLSVASEFVGDRENAIKTCKNWFTNIRIEGWVSDTTGKVVPLFGETSQYAGLFRHSGYALKGEPDGWKRDLDKKFVLTRAIYFKGGGGITCSGPLLGTGFSVKE